MGQHEYTGARFDLVAEPSVQAPILTIVVDTEEEFDWSAPFSRANTSTKSVEGQLLAHEVFDPLGIKPLYVVDQAIVDNDAASDVFQSLLERDRCEIGAHLHPWLTLPFEEEVNNRNSFQGNLPKDLEYAKIKNLRDSIESRFGTAPKVFKAGRYGVGPNTFATLKSLGFEIDCSVLPHTDYRYCEGPNFTGLPDRPFWIDEIGGLLELPLSRGFVGSIRGFSRPLQGVFDSKLAGKLKLPGMLSKTGLLKRITLTPEGMPAKEQMQLLQHQYKAGARVFSLAYHSSSLGIGNTPYVRTESDLKDLLNNLKQVLMFFQQELGGCFMSVTEVGRLIREKSGGSTV